jgi:hypothetical protein
MAGFAWTHLGQFKINLLIYVKEIVFGTIGTRITGCEFTVYG